MRFVFGKQDLADSARRAEHCFLLTNGLGGFCSQTLTGGAARNDHALLRACTRAPNVRWNIVHRVEEELTRNGAATHLSTQTFAKGSPEEGWQNLCFAQVDGLPWWVYQWQGVQVEKELAMDWEQNTVALRYQLENPGDTPCTLTVTPWLQFVPKGKNLRKTQTFTLRGNRVTAAGLDLTVRTNGQLTPCPLGWQTLYYPCDAPDGRRKTGLTAACKTAPPSGMRTALRLSINPPAKGFGGKDSVKGNRQGSLSRWIKQLFETFLKFQKV